MSVMHYTWTGRQSKLYTRYSVKMEPLPKNQQPIFNSRENKKTNVKIENKATCLFITLKIF